MRTCSPNTFDTSHVIDLTNSRLHFTVTERIAHGERVLTEEPTSYISAFVFLKDENSQPEACQQVESKKNVIKRAWAVQVNSIYSVMLKRREKIKSHSRQ